MTTRNRHNAPLWITAAATLFAAIAAASPFEDDLEAYSRDFSLIEQIVQSADTAQIAAFIAAIAGSGLPQGTKIQIIAVTYVEHYARNNKTTFRERGQTRELGLSARVSDCSAMTVSILHSAGITIIDTANGFVRKSDGSDGFQGRIRMLAGARELRDPYRKGAPQVGDIMMWKGHMGIVTRVMRNVVFWANMGPGAGVAHQHAFTDSERGLAPGYWTTGKMEFWGFWTFPELNRLLNINPRCNIVIRRID